MAAVEWILRSRRAVLPEGIRPAAVHVAAGRIAAITGYADIPPATRVVEAGEEALLPGLVDSHVHVNEPGRAHWEGFATATRAAAAGGVTTLVDMPLNSVPATTDVAALAAKRAAAAGRIAVDVAFWGGLVPGNRAELEPLARAGVLGFKAFLSDPGVPEFAAVTQAELAAAAPRLARLGRPLLVHAEDAAELARAAAVAAGGDPRRHATWLATRPESAEVAAIAALLDLCRRRPFRLHIVHLASPAALPLLAGARAAGLPVTVETCPHYLTFAAEAVQDGATSFKCAPPIRPAAAREALWGALGCGAIDLLASDHSPCPPDLKRPATGDFLAAWGGIAGIELALPAVWTEAARRGFDLGAIARWMSAAPARLAGLAGRKGALAVGYDADVVLFDPEPTWTVAAAGLHQRHPVTPYAGLTLRGTVRATWLRGEEIYRDGVFPAGPRGQLLAAPATAAGVPA